MSAREVAIELSQAERQALLQWNFTPEVRDQLEPLAGRRGVESIRITRTDLLWLISDLNHAIVKRGCRDERAVCGNVQRSAMDRARGFVGTPVVPRVRHTGRPWALRCNRFEV